MGIKGLIFDVNGTLTDINTNEAHDEIYRFISNLLSYQGVLLSPNRVKDQYYSIMKEQKNASDANHPEFDSVGIFREMIWRNATDYTRRLPGSKLEQLPLFIAEAFRAASRNNLHLYPGVEDVLRKLHGKYHLAVVSDGQSAYAFPEIHAVGLLDYFNPLVVSGDFGIRKPSRTLFEHALSVMKMPPGEVVFVGNDMYRDIHGARRLGMKTVFFKTNQGRQEKKGVEADYIIYDFPQLLDAVRFFEN
jgi:putative hydrolase of the HAD superfamily